MSTLPARQNDLFDELGLEVTHGEVEVGETYPIFGMITSFVDETPGKVVVEINYGIRAKIGVQEEEQISVLKDRVLESAIFVSKVTSKEPSVEVECQTIIFGRKPGFNA